MNEDHAEHDPLGDQLRREAEAEQPAFSQSLHARIMQGIREEQVAVDSSHAMRWIFRLAVAAVIVAMLGLTTLIIVRSRHVTAPSPQIAVVAPQAVQPMPDFRLASLASQSALTVDFGGLVSARVSPTGITMGLRPVRSTPAEPAPTLPKAIPGSPDWMMGKLQEPTSSAAEALADLLPPETRLLIDLAASKW